VDWIPANHSWSQPPPSNAARGLGLSSTMFADPLTPVKSARPKQSALSPVPTSGFPVAIRTSIGHEHPSESSTSYAFFPRALSLSPSMLTPGNHVGHPYSPPALGGRGFPRSARKQGPDFDIAVTSDGTSPDVQGRHQVNGDKYSPRRTTGTKRAADGLHVDSVPRGDILCGTSEPDTAVGSADCMLDLDAEAHGPETAADPASSTGLYPIQYPGLLPCPSPPSHSYRSLVFVSPAAIAEAPLKRGRGRPKGSGLKKSGTAAAEATGEEAPRRKRGRPPKVRIILISLTYHVPPSHHSSLSCSLSYTRRERLKTRVSILHPSENAVVLPRTPSRTPITSSLLPSLAPRRGRSGRVDLARSRMIDTTN